MWLFGKKKEKVPEKAPIDITETSQKLSDQIRMNDLNINKQEKIITDLHSQAKTKLKAKDKRGAAMCMKKKKMYEAEISKMEGMNMMLEKQKMAMESNMNNANVFDAMQNASSTIDQMQKNSNIDQFDELREKHEEQMDQNSEVMDFFKDYAEEGMDDADDMLNELEAEMAEEDMNTDIASGDIKEQESAGLSTAEMSKKEEEDLLADMMG